MSLGWFALLLWTTPASGVECCAEAGPCLEASGLCDLIAQCEIWCEVKRSHRNETVIPLVLHQMWKTGEVPVTFSYFVHTVSQKHPGWRYFFWTDDDLPWLFRGKWTRSLSPLQRSDVARYVIMEEYGGFYLDLDMEIVRSLDPFLLNPLVLGQEPLAHALFLYSRSNLTCNAILGSAPHLPLWKSVLDRAWTRLESGFERDAVKTTGPLLLADVVHDVGLDADVLPPDVFYPLLGPGAMNIVKGSCSASHHHLLPRGTTPDQLHAICSRWHTTKDDDSRRQHIVFDNVINGSHSNDTVYAAHHWVHTNLWKGDCRYNQKTFSIRALLESGAWRRPLPRPPSKRDPQGRIVDDTLHCPLPEEYTSAL